MKLLDLVVATKECPDENIKAGDVGTVVHVLPKDGEVVAVVVEFLDPGGYMRGLLEDDVGAFRLATEEDLARDDRHTTGHNDRAGWWLRGLFCATQGTTEGDAQDV